MDTYPSAGSSAPISKPDMPWSKNARAFFVAGVIQLPNRPCSGGAGLKAYTGVRIAVAQALQRQAAARHDGYAVARSIQLGLDRGGHLYLSLLGNCIGLSLALAVVERAGPCAVC